MEISLGFLKSQMKIVNILPNRESVKKQDINQVLKVECLVDSYYL